MAVDANILRIVTQLNEGTLTGADRRRALFDFARINGWRPSDIEDYPAVAELANAHLVVEHGLSNAVVISFLKSNMPYKHLDRQSQLQLLGLSYNNMVDWHFFPDKEGVHWVFNRTDPPSDGRLWVSDDPNSWSARAFDKIVDRRPSPNVKALDDALIMTISEWRRKLALDLADADTTRYLSLLFNSILFARALEDTLRAQDASLPPELLLSLWNGASPPKTFGQCITKAFRILQVTSYPSAILGAQSRLKAFDALARDTVMQLLADFYHNAYSAPYRYDFSIMSKHALSRIYERYVSILREKDSPQMRLFPDLPEEVRNRALGGVYTPQYIARFFAKYLKESHTPPAFRSLRVADPACGSGIFPRTLLELQCDPLQDIDVDATVDTLFTSTYCLDIDSNACQATRLSLALLHLVLTRRIPSHLNVIEEETIDYFSRHKHSLSGTFDAVMANPPYIKLERISTTLQDRFCAFLGDLATGRVDAYLAHLEVGLQLVKPGGFVLYVLPHAFLIANNAAQLRRRVAQDYWVRVLVDLSDISVFEAGSYVILLVLQRKTASCTDEPLATLAKCKQFVGHALQDVLEGKFVTNEFYSTYAIPQSFFSQSEWHVLHPQQILVRSKLSRHSRLDTFLDVREGFVTGADDVFIRNRRDVPRTEKDIYKPYLPDRAMSRYVVPSSLEKVVLYPYRNGDKLTLMDLKADYPLTWKYLESHHRMLSRRASVSHSKNPWWLPVRPRAPQNIMRPKIISPHLAILPRFALDREGDIMISHGPFMYPKDGLVENEALRYFVAVLNSKVLFWQIAHASHKYARGYLMLEKKTIEGLLVPNPEDVSPPRMAELQQLVEARLEGHEETESSIDAIVSELYGITTNELAELGL